MKRTTKLMSWFLVLALVLGLVPANQVEAAKKVTVKKVTVSSSLSGSTKTVVVAKGKKVKLKTTVTVTPNKAANKKVSYKSANKKIATVDSKGQVKGVKAGKTKITVTSKKDKKKKKTIAVKVMKGAVTKVTLDQASGTINVGEKVTLKATVTAKKGADKTLAWKSSKESVAKVSAKGEVTAIAAGTATITAQAIDGSGKKATYTVTVQDKPASPDPGSKDPGNTDPGSKDPGTQNPGSQTPVTPGQDSLVTANNDIYPGIIRGIVGESVEEDCWVYDFANEPVITGKPKGLEIDYNNGSIFITGTLEETGSGEVLITGEDDEGNSVTKRIPFVIGSEDSIVGMALPVYGMCAGSGSVWVDKAFAVAGGSGDYAFEKLSDSNNIVDSVGNGWMDCIIPAAGKYSVTVKVTDEEDSGRHCEIEIPFDFAQGNIISGRITDSQGNAIPGAYVDFSNVDPTNEYCQRVVCSTGSDGVYRAGVTPGTYNIYADFSNAAENIYSKALTAAQSDLDIKLPLVRIKIKTDNAQVSAGAFEEWIITDGDEYGGTVGYGDTVWLREGTYTLISQKTTASRESITATVSVAVTAQTTEATATVTVTSAVVGTIESEQSVEVKDVTGAYKYYTFTPTASGTYHFWSESDEDTYGILEDKDGEYLYSDDDSGSGNDFYFPFECEAGVTYYVGIRLYGQGYGTATLHISTTEPNFDEPNLGEEE